MNSLCFRVCACFLFTAAAWNAAADDDTLTGVFQRGDTYIRYHLTPGALQVENDAATTFTLNSGTIDAIDAYFECLPEQSFPDPPAFQPQRQLFLVSSATAAILPPTMAIWNIGNLALGLGYHDLSAATSQKADSWRAQPLEQALAGHLLFPLGDTGFSFGAAVLMHAARTQWRAAESSFHALSSRDVSNAALNVPAMSGYAAAPSTGSSRMSLLLPEQESDQIAFSGTRSTVAGAVNVSGDVKGVQVFTEVGFVSGADVYDDEILLENEAATASNFYAVGGANYTVGQVTFGFEAGFENGEDVLEENTSLGFENDFFLENLLPESHMEQQHAQDKVYASVSAKLSPTERMTLGGAFTYIQPLRRAIEPYGFEVDGAFYYSLSRYLKYLAKAGLSLPSSANEEHQYKIMNGLEVSF